MLSGRRHGEAMCRPARGEVNSPLRQHVPTSRSASQRRAMAIPIKNIGTGLGHAGARAGCPWHFSVPTSRSALRRPRHPLIVGSPACFYS